jgi:Cu(I)/Ag(I) efflux system membrane fusion protein
MMTPEGGGSRVEVSLSAVSRKQISNVVTASEAVANAFKAGKLDEVHFGFSELEKAIKAVDMKLLQDRSHMLWMEVSMLLGNDAVEGKEAKTLQEAERIVESLKTNLASLETKFGLSQEDVPKVFKDVNPEFRKQLEGLFKGYFSVQTALAKDRLDEAMAGVSKIKEALAAVDMKLLSDTEHHVWMKDAAALEKIISDTSKAKDIEVLRQVFALLSEQMLVVARQFGPPSKSALYQLRCPMAFNNRGATWLQQDEDTRNPYFGSTMLKCGGVIEVIEPAGDKNIGGREHD